MSVKITVVHGQMHKGTTYHVTQMLIGKAFDDPEVVEFFLPDDGPGYCCGCNTCFFKGEDKCPHFDKVGPIVESMIASDVIIFDSPTYCMGVSGQMKTLMDHLEYMWMAHRPDPSMFKKIGIAVSSCAGRGSDDTVGFIREQMTMIGIPRTFGVAVVSGADRFENVSEENMVKISSKASKSSQKIRRSKAGPGLKFKMIYGFMRKNQERNDWNELDKGHWASNGWLDGKRPWK